VPGAAPLSSQRRQAPAGHHRPVPNQPVEDDASHQFAIISGFQLSAISTKPSAGNPAVATNPHRRSSVHRFPAGSFFRGFRTPALYRIDRSCSGRHPKPFRKPVIPHPPRQAGRPQAVARWASGWRQINVCARVRNTRSVPQACLSFPGRTYNRRLLRRVGRASEEWYSRRSRIPDRNYSRAHYITH